MESVLLVQGIILTIILLAVAWKSVRNDPTLERKLARVRVPVDDRRRAMGEPKEEEDFDPRLLADWLIFGFIAVLVFVLLSKVM